MKAASSFVSLFKALCDVTVFSNNVKLWQTLLGRPLSEGVVSIAGVGSAATVLYNNWPREEDKED